ncbi:coiled-coil domain-containing protein 180-like isoform X2 [Lineus longissimus]|uniref:coiled-coil domain-containing protein 180-like isoform X2 n=1 Tax=Lineus longissimus TaxID=88925 RepID=UPI00315DAE10
MAEVHPPRKARVVRSGKVYRQIFDAEVQLVKSYNDISEKKAQDQHTVKERPGGIPVVKDQLTNSGGMLTERQRYWVDGFPNDNFTQNPVLYKQVAEVVKQQMKEPESRVCGKEVQGLPDLVIPAKTGSDIIDRIAQNRKERHEATVEDMHQELSVISAELEPLIVKAGEETLALLSENDKVIDALLAKIEKDEDLLKFCKIELYDLWSEIESQSVIRRQAIQTLDDKLTTLEQNRKDEIREVFRTYTEMFEKISHLMVPDLQRFMDRESQSINQSLLSNKRAYSDLYGRLLTADIDREKRHHTIWCKRLDDWKRLNTELAVENFSAFMRSDSVVSPPEVEKILLAMITEEESQNNKRLELINSLKEMMPPASTKSAVYQWNQQVMDITKEIDTKNQDFLQRLYQEYEKACQNCLVAVEEMKASLIESGVCTEQKAKEVINEHCLPLIGERQTQFENTLETMDKTLEEENKMTIQQLKSLFKFAQGSAHVWDVHEIGLARQERGLQEKLENCRHDHDNENQDKEANLDIIMDRMRQDASEAALTESLKKALEMLSAIKQGYEVFHENQLDIVKFYPSMVKKELEQYDAAICKFFGVQREQKIFDTESESPSSARLEDDSSPKAKGSMKKKTKAKRPSDRVRSKTPDEARSPLPAAVAEVLSTSKGTQFFVLTIAGEHGIQPDEPSKEKTPVGGDGDDAATFMTEVEVESVPKYISTIHITNGTFNEIKKQVRLNFLDHLEDWVNQAIERSNSVVAAKCEELNSELDLRQHLHKPRSRRAEMDVHNVRAAELVMHNERVTRHCRGITQALNDLKQRFNDLTHEHNKLLEKFRNDIEALETVFVNATKSSKLIALSNTLSEELEKFMNQIRISLRHFRKHVDDTLQMLRDSNARFIRSFKIFSDGGNFCPEEIEEYRKRLEKMSHKIDSSEGFIMSDLEGMEAKHLEKATKVSNEFEDRFKNHMIDLIFMEKIARWLTNSQVKIKAEVAYSNTHAQKLAQHLMDLERRIDACQRPNLDKEQITPTELNASLKEIFDAFLDRASYLNCLKDPTLRPQSAVMQGNPALGAARVGFSSEVTPTPITKAGKQPVEDPSIGVIKNILKTQKSPSKSQTGAGGEADGEVSPVKVRERRPTITRPPTDDMEGKLKSAMKKVSTVNTPVPFDPPKRALSGLRRTTSKKQDKKYILFTELDDPEHEQLDASHFLLKIKKIIKDASEGLNAASETYYRHKGTRPVTRPQALQETFEQSSDTIVQKLMSYFHQADEYHNQCLQEFRVQLNELEASVSNVPGLVIRELLTSRIKTVATSQEELEAQFSEKKSGSDNKKEGHQNMLRPTLGHPQQREDMLDLCKTEDDRRRLYLENIEEHTQNLQADAVNQAEVFIQEVAKLSEQLLLQFDSLLTVDDVEKGRVEPKKYPTSELIRRKNAGMALEDDESKTAVPRGKKTWTGVPRHELAVVSDGKLAKAKLTASVTTAKTTFGHTSTTKARDRAYLEYKQKFEEILANIEEEKQCLITDEERWTDSWLTSVAKVKMLY